MRGELGTRKFSWDANRVEATVSLIRQSRTIEEVVQRVSAHFRWPISYATICSILRRYGQPTVGSLLLPPSDPLPREGAPPAPNPDFVTFQPDPPPLPPASPFSSTVSPPRRTAEDLPPLDWDEDESATQPREFEEERPSQVDVLLEEQNAQTERQRDKKTIGDLLDQLRQARSRQAFIDAASSYRATPKILAREKETTTLRELTAVVLASDWHVEEPVDPEAVAGRNAYNLTIADARVERFFRGIIWHITHHRASDRLLIRDLVLWLGGDFCSGFIHPELVESNLLSPTETVRWLLPRLRNGIATLLDHLDLDHIEIPCSYGNHGRTTDKPRISTGYANSYEWLMYHSLADEFKHEPRVHFEITNSPHQYVEVYGKTLHFHHGDDVKYMGGVGGLGIPLLKAVPLWERVKAADVHCIGHHHTFTDYGRIVVNGSLIGFGPYSQRIRAPFEPPQQAIFYMDSKRGKCMTSAIWVDKDSDLELA